jgi:hypothetical protein
LGSAPYNHSCSPKKTTKHPSFNRVYFSKTLLLNLSLQLQTQETKLLITTKLYNKLINKGAITNMKKVAILLIVGILIGSTMGTIGTTSSQPSAVTFSDKITTPALHMQSTASDNYLILGLTNTDTYLQTAGAPRLPKIVKTLELPFGATDISISLVPQDIRTEQITQQVDPAAALLPLTDDYQTTAAQTTLKDDQIYTMTTPYPAMWYTTKIGVGLNKDNQHVTFVTVDYYPIRYTPATGTLLIAGTATYTLTYTPPSHTPFPVHSQYTLVIIAPQKFQSALQPLVDHKNAHAVPTFLKTTEDIYASYAGVDKPEQIKYFIKDAIETYGISAVLLIGGVKNVIMSKPRDDPNQGSKGWYLPVRYTNLFDNPKFPLQELPAFYDPGVASDLYYADIYGPNGTFSSWDPNGDGIFAAWGKPGVANDTGLDLYPDVALGRLPCTSVTEVRTVVKKIITYETTTNGSDWFKKMTVISGDGFLDQTDLDIQWDTSTVANGAYTIHAQSNNPSADYGPIETINITVDKTQTTNLTFNQNDNLRIHSYPGLPMAEICTVSEGNILGNTDYTFTPGEDIAYCNEFYHWANMSYVGGVLTIRGKSYDPKPYGNLSSIHVWVTDNTDTVVFEDWRNNTTMYYEGEDATGNQTILGRGGALYYMPSDFEQNVVWASNGRFTGQQDVINAWNEGAGFMFLSGHGSPNAWADHYPGIPGNRQYGEITGLEVTTLHPWAPFFTPPVFPIDTLKNKEKLPIAVIGGCHNSQFNVSMIYGMMDILYYVFPHFPKLHMWCYGYPVPEGFSWRLVRNPHGGAIASMGNTGLGYGMPGIDVNTGGGDSWITIEFFKQYGTEGFHVLGQAYQQTLTSYIDTFDMTDLAAGHTKTVQQWILFGDPTLQIGGY